MSERQEDPFFHINQCNMCMEKSTNFVSCLCSRCHSIWTAQRSSEDKICLKQVKACIVARVTQMDAISPDMDPTFRQALESEAIKRREKLHSFHQVRDKFQNSIVIDAFDRANPHNCDNRYCKAPLVVTSSDFAKSQYEMDLLKDMKKYEKSLSNETDFNSNYFNVF